MKLGKIKQRAAIEKPNITGYLGVIAEAICAHPEGYDIILPPGVGECVEEYCDAHSIPIYHVTEDCYSVAATYKDLYTHESER